MSGVRTKIGAGATLAALGGLAGYAISSGEEHASATTAVANRQPVEVQTQTIHRTVRIVRREKPNHPRQRHGAGGGSGGGSAPRHASAAAPAPAPAAAAAPPAPAVAARPVASSSTAPVYSRSHVTTRTSGGHSAAPAPAHTQHHVTTRTSGSSGSSGSGEREHDGGDREGGDD